ncbi:MAG: hypothetical protein WBA25_06890 [Jannaschia sp.]
MTGLDCALREAHSAHDPASLARLYVRAAEDVAPDAAAFFRTQAWIFALEAGLPLAARLEAELRQAGRA